MQEINQGTGGANAQLPALNDTTILAALALGTRQSRVLLDELEEALLSQDQPKTQILTSLQNIDRIGQRLSDIEAVLDLLAHNQGKAQTSCEVAALKSAIKLEEIRELFWPATEETTEEKSGGTVFHPSSASHGASPRDTTLF